MKKPSVSWHLRCFLGGGFNRFLNKFSSLPIWWVFFFRWVGKNHQPVSHLLWVLPGPWLYPTGSLGICEHHYTSRRHAEYRTLAKKLGSSERCWVFFGMLQKTAKNCASLKMAIFVEWWMKNLEWWCFFFQLYIWLDEWIRMDSGFSSRIPMATLLRVPLSSSPRRLIRW